MYVIFVSHYRWYIVSEHVRYGNWPQQNYLKCGATSESTNFIQDTSLVYWECACTVSRFSCSSWSLFDTAEILWFVGILWIELRCQLSCRCFQFIANTMSTRSSQTSSHLRSNHFRGKFQAVAACGLSSGATTSYNSRTRSQLFLVWGVDFNTCFTLLLKTVRPEFVLTWFWQHLALSELDNKPPILKRCF